jgi:PR domain zinc finger protein 10
MKLLITTGKPLPMANRKKDCLMQTPGLPNSNYSTAVGSITTHPHYCDWCHKQYASKAKLLQHQRKKHPEKLPIINLNAKSRSKITTQLIEQNTFVTTSQVATALTNLTNLNLDASNVVPSVVEISSSSSNLISNSVVDINSLEPFTSQPSPSSSISSSNNTASNTESAPTALIGTNLITILGNIPNLSNIMMMPASSHINLNETSGFQELLQNTQPLNTSDLLTQAMSELTQTKDSMTIDEAATFLVPASNNQITWF